MNECSLNKGRVALVASVAANIFLIAFLAGQLTAPRPLPPPPDDIGRLGAGRGFGHAMFGPRDFFGPRGDPQHMSKEFEQMDALRKAFADQLKAGNVTKEQALEHFRQMDQVMDAVRSDARERVAEKISTMSEEERARFAQRLLERRRHGMRGPQPGTEALPPPPENEQPLPQEAPAKAE